MSRKLTRFYWQHHRDKIKPGVFVNWNKAYSYLILSIELGQHGGIYATVLDLNFLEQINVSFCLENEARWYFEDKVKK